MTTTRIISRLAILYNVQTFLGEAYDLEWMVFDVISTVVVQVPIGVLAAGIDSWSMSRSTRLFFLLAGALYYFKSSLESRYPNDWWPADTARDIYSSMESQMAMFLFKGFIAYARGWRFAFVRPFWTTAMNEAATADVKVATSVVRGQLRDVSAAAAASDGPAYEATPGLEDTGSASDGSRDTAAASNYLTVSESDPVKANAPSAFIHSLPQLPTTFAVHTASNESGR